MFIFGLSQLIYLSGIIATIVVYRRRTRIRSIGPALVIRKFQIVPNPSDGVCVLIVGRVSGIVQWLMTILKIDTETTFKIKSDRLEKRSFSLSGQEFQILPISKVTTTICGYSRSLWLLVLGSTFIITTTLNCFALFLEGVSQTFESDSPTTQLAGSILVLMIYGFLFFGTGIGLIIGYLLSKRLSLIIDAAGGIPIGIHIKPSLIENVQFDLNQALEVVQVLNELVIDQSNPGRINQVHPGNRTGVPATFLNQVPNARISPAVQSPPIADHQNRPGVPQTQLLQKEVVQPGPSLVRIETKSGNSTHSKKQCPYCLEPLTDDTLYCEECGRQVLCRQCHQLLVKDSQTCTGCGEVLAVR